MQYQHAKRTPILVLFHWKQEVKELLDDSHVKNGILQEIPIGTPVHWCSTMVVTVKKDGRPRITVYLQHRNSQCLQETHHTPSAFQMHARFHPIQKKSIEKSWMLLMVFMPFCSTKSLNLWHLLLNGGDICTFSYQKAFLLQLMLTPEEVW